MINSTRFVKNIPYGIYLFGVATVGFLGYRLFQWITSKCQNTAKIDQIAQKDLASQASDQTKLLLAKNLQSASRGLLGRIKRKQTQAAIKIQSIYRGHFARSISNKEKAVVTLQRVIRSHCERVRVEQRIKPLISHALLEKAKTYIDNPSSLNNVRKAPSGKTTVYLLNDLPIVLKASGSPANQNRFNQMQQARKLCEQNNYQHLVIPKARLYKDFIVESRLPIKMLGTKRQMGLYSENRAAFTGVVKEFTGFLCQSSFYDIVGGSYDPYGVLSKTPLGRYDNIALYLEGDQGKIGLIDLERFEPNCKKWQKEWCFFKCRDAVHLFPYHLDDIMAVARNFDPNIEQYRNVLVQQRDEALKRFKIAYEDHRDFAIKKKISFDNPLAFEKLSPEREAQLKKVIEADLRRRNAYNHILGDKPEDTLVSFNKKALPVILNAVYNLINKQLKYNFKDCQDEGPISSYIQLLSLRTIIFDYTHRQFENETSSSIEMLKIQKSMKRSFLNELLVLILKEFEKGKEIAYFNPDFGYGGYSKLCIFC